MDLGWNWNPVLDPLLAQSPKVELSVRPGAAARCDPQWTHSGTLFLPPLEPYIVSLLGIWNGSGVDLGWIWGGSGMVLGWIWHGSGVDLGWNWGGSGMDLGSGSGSGPDPVLIRP